MGAYHIRLCSVCHLVSEANYDDQVQAQVSVPRMPHAVHELETWGAYHAFECTSGPTIGQRLCSVLGEFSVM